MCSLVGRIRLAWRRKRVRALTYTLAVLVAVYVTLLVVWDPPNDDGPLPTLGGITETSRIEPLYTRIARDLTGRDVEVRCWSEADWAERSKEVTHWTRGKMRPGEWTAYVSYDYERANLSPAICRSLGRWAYERRWPEGRWGVYNFVWSIKVLAHETQHLKEIANEAKADCYGLQTMTEVAARLGIEDGRARWLANYAWHYIYPRARGEYWSAECRDGGELDIRRGSSIWP
jgi:hypothetical protein